MPKDYNYMHNVLYQGFEAIKEYLKLTPLPKEVKPIAESIETFSIVTGANILAKIAETQENYEDAKALLKAAHNNLEKYLEKHIEKHKSVISTEISSALVVDIMIKRYQHDLNIALKELNHLKAQAYLEKHIGELQEEKINTISALGREIHQSTDVLVGLCDAIQNSFKEQNQNGLKIVLFLEDFYDSAPICGSYTEETHEKNFEVAVNVFCHSLLDTDTVDFLGKVYSGYVSDGSVES